MVFQTDPYLKYIGCELQVERYDVWGTVGGGVWEYI